MGREAPARFIEAFVEELKLEGLGFKRTQAADTGRPPYHPRDLLKLYLYGYLNRIRSSRRLEAEATRNLELIWLLRGLRPDFKTIADFRKDNRGVFKAVFRQFNLVCRTLNLFGAELVAIDGCKFKAVNNAQRYFTQAQMQEMIKTIEENIESYLTRLDGQDQQAEGTANPNRQELQAKIEQLKERKGDYGELLKEMVAAKQKHIALTDPDSRWQKKVGLGYNVQMAVDAKHHLIVEQQVVQEENDRGQLSKLALATKQELGVAQLKVVADAGYHEAEQLEKCEQAQIETYVSAPGTTSGKSTNGKKVYPKEAFKYDAATDSYQCPAGQRLERGYESESKGKDRTYYYNIGACANCPQRGGCTATAYRKISRLANETVVERQALRTAAHLAIIKLRKAIVEHVFGTLRNWGHDNFLMRGLEKVGAETSLSSLAYNLRRVLSLISLDSWMKATKAEAKMG